jgi:cell division protein FtsX
MNTEPQVNAQDIIVREGLAAADLLASDALRSVIYSINVQAFTAFTETKPNDAAAREHHYQLTQGLKAIEAELLGRKQAMEELQRKLDEEATYDADEDPFSLNNTR